MIDVRDFAAVPAIDNAVHLLIREAVWLYFRFILSFPDVEELMVARERGQL